MVEILQRDAVYGGGRATKSGSEKLPGMGWVGQEDDKLPRVGVWRLVCQYGKPYCLRAISRKRGFGKLQLAGLPLGEVADNPTCGSSFT